ncbi:MAG: hypothetical protein [Olavius algarvensis Delta 4 endosymbiont]|nr:MAG: hypothetical protein [Olavius algarvensis Delta 4 endosymbiont]
MRIYQKMDIVYIAAFTGYYPGYVASTFLSNLVIIKFRHLF